MHCPRSGVTEDRDGSVHSAHRLCNVCPQRFSLGRINMWCKSLQSSCPLPWVIQTPLPKPVSPEASRLAPASPLTNQLGYWPWVHGDSSLGPLVFLYKVEDWCITGSSALGEDCCLRGLQSGLYPAAPLGLEAPRWPQERSWCSSPSGRVGLCCSLTQPLIPGVPPPCWTTSIF